MTRFAAFLLYPVLALALLGCSPVMKFHGYAPDDVLLRDIEVGRDTRDSVAEKIGRPGVSGVMEGSAWYYVQSDWVHRGWNAPEEVAREVVAVSFDTRGRVSNVERFGLQDGEVVALSRRVTSSGPRGMTILRQILGNFGQLNPGQMLSGR